MARVISLAFGLFIFLNNTAFSLDTEGIARALFSLSDSQLDQKTLSSKDLERALLENVEDYRDLFELAKKHEILSNEALNDSMRRCETILDEIAIANSSVRSKLVERIKKEVDDRIAKISGEKPKRKTLILKYNRALDRLIDHAVLRYAIYDLAFIFELSHRKMPI